MKMSHRGTKGQENGNGNGGGGGGGGWVERGNGFRMACGGRRRCRGGGVVTCRVKSSLCTAMTQSESVRVAHGRAERHLHSLICACNGNIQGYTEPGGYIKTNEKKEKKKSKDVVWWHVDHG